MKGFTLTELLAVVAIVAIMAGVALPAFSRLGLFSGNERKETARTVYAMLKETRSLAATLRTDAAVVYDGRVEINETDPRFAILNMVQPAKAAKLTLDMEQPFAAYIAELFHRGVEDRDRDNVFVQVNLSGFRAFDNTGLVPNRDADAYDYCLCIVHLLLPDGAFVPMLAHVFHPDGSLRRCVTNNREMYPVFVGFNDEADPAERLNEKGDKLRVLPIELQCATGRVAIARDLQDIEIP